jgi:glycosyltransferase involved in cell wall biosynthesis
MVPGYGAESSRAPPLISCRILYLVGQLRRGGTEQQLYFLLQGMDRKYYRPQVVVWNFREDDVFVPQIRALGVPLHSLAGAPSRVAKLRAFRYMIMQINPEVVHSHSHTNFAAWWATRGTKTIAIGSVRSDLIWAKKQWGPLVGRLSARWPRTQIFNSFAAAENARRSRSLFAPGQSFVVRNGLDLQRFQMLPWPPSGRMCIIGVGSLLPVKRWDRLLTAAQALKRCGFDFLVRIVGEGPLSASLKQQAQVLGIADHVEFSGQSDNIPGLLADATFLAHTSESEGCPNVVMEAMACGRAVVAMDAGDIPLLVVDGTSGFIVPQGDDAAFVARMASLVTDRDLCRRMGEVGRAKAEREFGLDRLVSETFAAYKAAGWQG